MARRSRLASGPWGLQQKCEFISARALNNISVRPSMNSSCCLLVRFGNPSSATRSSVALSYSAPISSPRMRLWPDASIHVLFNPPPNGIFYCFAIGAVALSIWLSNRRIMEEKADVWQGTLALMVLKTLETMGPLHGYGIARRIEQTSGDLLSINYGTLYPALLKLEQEGYIASEWGTSDNNRKAKYYRLTRAGRRQLVEEAREREQTNALLARSTVPKEESS